MITGTVQGYQKGLDVIVYPTFLVCHVKDSLYSTFVKTFTPKWGVNTNPFDLHNLGSYMDPRASG